MTPEEALEEVEKLRAAIRAHRDEKGHDRCWLDDLKLYAALPEGAATADLTLPPKAEFMRGCDRYYELRRTRAPEEADSEARSLARDGSLGTDDLRAAGRLDGLTEALGIARKRSNELWAAKFDYHREQADGAADAANAIDDRIYELKHGSD